MKLKPPVQKQVPFLPKLILSGSATSLTALQVKKLEMDTDIENTYFVSLRLDDVLKEPDSALVDRIVANLGKRQYCSCPCLRFNRRTLK